MQKVLITGSNGFVGQKLLEGLQNRKDLTAIASARKEDKSSSKGLFPFEILDITNPSQVEKCFQKHKPDVVIHTAAMSLADLCEKNPEECWKINVTGTENLVKAAESFKSHFLHLSTDFVFDGTAGPYREEDLAHPLSSYGKSKLASEQIVMKSKTSWAIARTVLVYGILPVMPRGNIITFVKDNLEKKKPIKVVNDQIRTPTLAEDLTAGCLQIAAQKATGIFHLSGNEMLSVYELAKLIAGTFNLDASLMAPVTTASLQEAAKRPLKTGFILEKAQKILNYKPHSLQDGLKLVKNQCQGYSS